METFNETQNAKKYGAKDADLIAQNFNISLELGIIFCVNNISRYATRYNSNAEKGHNPADIAKMLDYVNRALQKTNNDYFKLLSELKVMIENNKNCVTKCLEISKIAIMYEKPFKVSNNKKYAENLRIFRMMFGYSQEYIGIKIGVSSTAYAKYERCETIITQKVMVDICGILGIDVNTLKTFDKNIYLKNSINND
jgi:DNA-binding XRE family transcriptional regulator